MYVRVVYTSTYSFWSACFKGVLWSHRQEVMGKNSHDTHSHDTRLVMTHLIPPFLSFLACWFVVLLPQSMGWLRLVGSLKLNLQVSFAEYSLFYTAVLHKRPVIWRSLLTVATPPHSSFVSSLRLGKTVLKSLQKKWFKHGRKISFFEIRDS